MRLLECVADQSDESVTVNLVEFIGSQIPTYATLSHRWKDEEVQFQDMINRRSGYTSKRGYAKIEGCAREALNHGIEYIWVDTCCIDKRSSAELTEAINSMFQWYSDSAICFAYLDDVLCEKDVNGSLWFSRGW